jgi:hypothetical protein
MVAILAAVAMLSAGLALVPIQGANANIVMDEEDGGDTEFSFEQDQSNKCSGSTVCENGAEILFGLLK